MAVGYACIALGLRNSNMRSCLLKNAGPANLNAMILANLENLERIIDYNQARNIRLFRIGSGVIPFASHPVNANRWWEEQKTRLKHIGGKIKAAGIRVSMHVPPFTVLNSPDPRVVENALADIEYHSRFLDTLSLDQSHRIIIHPGGIYGHLRESRSRFIDHFKLLSASAQARLTLENDEKYDITSTLETASALAIPVVFDVLHHRLHPAPEKRDEADWIEICRSTWSRRDGRQKIHYSQPDPALRTGAHSRTVRVRPFLEFYRSLDLPHPDIMLEVKDKDLSAIKCIMCLENNRLRLDEEWCRYADLVRAHSPSHYRQLQGLIDRGEEIELPYFFDLIETALDYPLTPENQFNALGHIWDRFSPAADCKEIERWQAGMAKYAKGNITSRPLKNLLMEIASRHGREDWLDFYFFI